MANVREPMKIVIINTKYVQTDAKSFKAVVQELTGKDSRDVTRNSSKQRSRFYQEQMNKKEGMAITPRVALGSTSRVDSFLMKNLSFKEFERLLKEMPPVDELLWNME